MIGAHLGADRVVTRKVDPVEPGLLCLRDAARFLAVSERTLFSFTERGDVPCVRIGRRKLYSLQSLQKWIERKERESGKSRF